MECRYCGRDVVGPSVHDECGAEFYRRRLAKVCIYCGTNGVTADTVCTECLQGGNPQFAGYPGPGDV